MYRYMLGKKKRLDEEIRISSRYFQSCIFSSFSFLYLMTINRSALNPGLMFSKWPGIGDLKMIIIIFFLKKIGSVWLTRILLLISKVNVRCIPYEKKTKKNNPKVNMFKGNF